MKKSVLASLAGLAFVLVVLASGCAAPAAPPVAPPPAAAADTAVPPTAAPSTQATAAPTEAATAAPTVAASTAPTATAATTATAAATATVAQAAAPAQAAGQNTLVIGAGVFGLVTHDPARAYELLFEEHMMYDSLVTYENGDIGTLKPALATKWEIAPDGLTYTFTLRSGVKFHTGGTLTSKDVKWSWDRAMGLKGNPSFLYEGVKSVATPDDNTVVVTLAAPDPSFLAKSTYSVFGVLDSAFLASHGGVTGPDAKDKDTAQAWLDQNSAGTGCFVLKGWKRDVEVDLEQFPGCWQGGAKLDKILIKNYASAEPEKLALQAGDIDMAMDLTSDDAKLLKDDKSLSMESGMSTAMFFMLLNRDPSLSNGVASNPAVAQAIRMSLDYEGIRSLSGDGALSPPTIVPVGLYAAWDQSKLTKHDPAGAKKVLADAGFPNGVDLTLIYPTKTAGAGVEYDLLAQKVQSDLAEGGIRVKLEPTEFQAGLKGYRAGTQAFAMWIWGMDFPDINNYVEFLPDRLVGKRAGWTSQNADPEILALRDAALKESDPAKRKQIWDDIQTYLVTKGPFVSVLQPGANVGLRSNVKGFVWNPLWSFDAYLLSKQ